MPFCSKKPSVSRTISLIIAKSVSTIKFDISSQGFSLKGHPILKLLNKPNPANSCSSFVESLISYRLISGNSFVVATRNIDGEVTELYSLRPDKVSVVTDKSGFVTCYEYINGDKVTKYYVDKITGKSDVLHFKNFNPLNEHYGLSSIEAAAYSIDQHNSAARWNQSLLQNGAKPSGALVVNHDKNGGAPNLSEEQFYRVKSQIEEQFMGMDNAGKPILLEGGLDWKEMSINPRDMDYIETKHTAAREIALAFGVPPQLLGIPGDNTYSNLSEARLALWEQTIIPLMNELAECLDNWLVPNFKKSDILKLSHDVNNIPALLPRREKLWERVSSADFLSDSEKREIVGIK